jgi:hypothetical protein
MGPFFLPMQFSWRQTTAMPASRTSLENEEVRRELALEPNRTAIHACFTRLALNALPITGA